MNENTNVIDAEVDLFSWNDMVEHGKIFYQNVSKYNESAIKRIKDSDIDESNKRRILRMFELEASEFGAGFARLLKKLGLPIETIAVIMDVPLSTVVKWVKDLY